MMICITLYFNVFQSAADSRDAVNGDYPLRDEGVGKDSSK
jgi:hypothetical protein